MSKSQLEIEQGILNEARIEVSYADHKASMVLAALGIGFGAVLGGLLAGDWAPSDLPTAGVWFWWLGATAALGSVAAASLAVWPRYKRPQPGAAITYWADVASFATFEELSAHIDENPSTTLDRTRRQMWELCTIVATKYRYVRAAFMCAGVAVALFLAASATTI